MDKEGERRAWNRGSLPPPHPPELGSTPGDAAKLPAVWYAAVCAAPVPVPGLCMYVCTYMYSSKMSSFALCFCLRLSGNWLTGRCLPSNNYTSVRIYFLRGMHKPRGFSVSIFWDLQIGTPGLSFSWLAGLAGGIVCA